MSAHSSEVLTDLGAGSAFEDSHCPLGWAGSPIRLERRGGKGRALCLPGAGAGSGWAWHFLAGSLSLPLMGGCPSWDQSGEWGRVWGQPLERKKKKSFLVTYFPKLLLAPVRPAWTPPPPTPSTPELKATVWLGAIPVRHGLSGSTSGQLPLV